MPDTPWVGLAAVVAMFVMPFLPNWLFEGPRTVKHWSHRHICGYCKEPWSRQHMCSPAVFRPIRHFMASLVGWSLLATSNARRNCELTAMTEVNNVDVDDG